MRNGKGFRFGRGQARDRAREAAGALAVLAFAWGMSPHAAVPRIYVLPGVVTDISERAITVGSDETDELVRVERPRAARASEGMEVGAHVTLRYTKDDRGRHLVRDIGAPAPQAGTVGKDPAPGLRMPVQPVFEPMSPVKPLDDDRLNLDADAPRSRAEPSHQAAVAAPRTCTSGGA